MAIKAFAAFLAVALFSSLSVYAGENRMIVHDVVAHPGDTITIEVEIVNDEEFVGFNFDLPLPAGVAYVEDSERLHRDKGHYFTFGWLETNAIRVLSVSMQSTPFEGAEGVIVTFDAVVETEPGQYELSLVRPVIGNVGAQNILTGTRPGRFTVNPR